MKRAVIYNRCSTEKEVQENAIEIQEQEAIRACERKGWEIIQIYKELETGRYADIRVEYQQLIHDISKRKFDIIVVKCQDRIMRNAGDWFKFIDLINEYDIQLYFYMEDKFYNYEEDDMLYGITMQMHAFYSKNLSKKIKQAHRTRQITLAHPNIGEIYGWKKIDMRTYVIDEKEAGYIRRGYELLREGKGFHTIANILYEEGARAKKAGQTYRDKRGKRIKYYSEKIPSATWRKLLYSTNMYGTVIMNKKVLPYGKRKRVTTPKEEWIYFENALPAIVSKEYYEETIEMHQKSMTSQGRRMQEYDRSVSVKGMHKWSGRLTCAFCGSRYYRMKVSRKGNKEPIIKWRCSKNCIQERGAESNRIGCKNIVVEEDRLEELLKEAIEKRFAGMDQNADDVIERVLTNIRGVFKENNVENQLLGIQLELRNQKKKKDILFDKLMTELITDADFKCYTEVIERDIESLIEQEKVLKTRKDAYKDYDVRIAEIRETLKSCIVVKVGMAKIMDAIREIRIDVSGKCKVCFDNEKLLWVLGEFGGEMNESKTEHGMDFEFVYDKPTVYEMRREKTNQLALEILRENPKLTIREVADRIGEKYSYVYTSVVKLREQNKL